MSDPRVLFVTSRRADRAPEIQNRAIAAAEVVSERIELAFLDDLET